MWNKTRHTYHEQKDDCQQKEKVISREKIRRRRSYITTSKHPCWIVNISDWRMTSKRKRKSCRRSLKERCGRRNQSRWNNCWRNHGKLCWKEWTRKEKRWKEKLKRGLSRMHEENEYKLPSKIRNERTYFVFQTDQNIEREGVLVWKTTAEENWEL